jgi:hypothetical protein
MKPETAKRTKRRCRRFLLHGLAGRSIERELTMVLGTVFGIRAGCCRRLCAALWLLAWLPLAVQAQPEPEATGVDAPREAIPYGSGMGLEILLTNSGFGLGGYHSTALDSATSFHIEASLSTGKDEREVKFFGFGGRSYIPDKANYLLMLPIQAGVTRRLFQNSIEDNFRPYLQVTGGPTLGWEYPYFNDQNGDGLLDDDESTYDAFSGFFKGHPRLGLGGMLALGAHFGRSEKVTQGVRIGYSFTYFFRGIQLLEPDVADAQHFFHTPTISITFGKLF